MFFRPICAFERAGKKGRRQGIGFRVLGIRKAKQIAKKQDKVFNHKDSKIQSKYLVAL